VWLRLERRDAQIIASRSPDGVTWSEVGRDTVGMSSTVHVGLVVTSHDDAALARAEFEHVAVEQSPTAAGWQSADIGAVGASGGAAIAEGTAVIRASGADIWGTGDEFHYAYQALHGNFDIEARVAGLDAVHEWTKAGLMIRGSTDAGSVHLSLFATPANNGVAFQRRLIAGGVSIHTSGPGTTPPVWLRLSRHGGTITAFARASSADAWAVVAQEWVPDLPATVLAGLAVTSHLDGAVAAATFDSVQIVPVP
jgi:regulation of enolase protein 1 (concanavalin A-like superfamily)